MAEATQYFFDYQEVLLELIKKQGIHEGRWQLVFELGFAAMNMSAPLSPTTPELVNRPAGLILVQRIGINRTAEENNLTLDAAKVNPLDPAKSTKRPKKR